MGNTKVATLTSEGFLISYDSGIFKCDTWDKITQVTYRVVHDGRFETYFTLNCSSNCMLRLKSGVFCYVSNLVKDMKLWTVCDEMFVSNIMETPLRSTMYKVKNKYGNFVTRGGLVLRSS